MTKRITQANTVVVPAVHADGVDGKVVAAKAVVVPVEVEAASAKAEVIADVAPATVVAEPVAAIVAPAPMAMVAAPLAAEPTAAAATAAAVQGDDDGGTDLTPYIVGGVLILGGALAVALSSGDTDPIATTPEPANTAPIFTSVAAFSVPENQAVTTVFYDANAADTQGNTITFSLGGTDAALFNIDPATGVVTLKASANFEAKPTYSFTVTAADNGTPPLSTTLTITATVTNVNEAPAFASATATATTPENISTTTVVFTAAAVDPEAAAFAALPVTTPPATAPAGAVVTYTLGGPDAGLFAINATTGAVTFRASPDFETTRSAAGTTTFTFTVTATDNGAPALASTVQTVTLTLTDVAEGPVFTSAATATVAENSAAATVIFDANATGATSFALSGPDAAAFDFNTTTGVGTLRASADFETKSTYNVTVTATGPTGTSTQNLVVSVTNVNEAPTFGAATTRTTTVAENSTAVLFTGGATDPDGTATPNTLTYTITGPDAAFFTVSPTGAVSFVNAPNFEARNPTYTFNLVATDQAGVTTTQVNTVNVTNVNETPTFTATTQAVSFAENGTGTVLTATATDPDGTAAPNTLAYTLTGADAALFQVSNAGVVTFRAAPDFETPRSAANSNVYSFNVVATDQGGAAVTQAETVTVTDIAVEGTRIDGGAIAAGTNTNFSAANGNVTFLESGSAGNISTISNFTNGDIIQTDVATSSYSFSSVGSDLVISLLNNGVSSQITLTGAAGNNFIFNEASAEQAVGFDFFRSTVAAAPAASGNIDGAGSVATYNAGTASNTYTDSAAAPNVTTISNFTSDDRIVVTGTTGANPYSFSSVGNDLVISFLANGVSSQITLTGVANPNVFVFNEATAEQAVGFDFFRYG